MAILLHFLLGGLSLMFGFQITVWFTLAVLFVLFDKQQKSTAAQRARGTILFSFMSLVGVAMLAVGFFLIGRWVWRAWKSFHGVS